MQRLSSSMARSNSQEAYKIAVETHTARAASGSPLLFVWDMVTTDAPFEALKFVLDAARPPLMECAEFEKTNGLSRHLSFTPRQRHTPTVTNIFEGVY